MPFGEIFGAVIFLIVIVIFGNIWYSIVNSILEKIKYKLFGKKNSTNWHTLNKDEYEKKNKWKNKRIKT